MAANSIQNDLPGGPCCLATTSRRRWDISPRVSDRITRLRNNRARRPLRRARRVKPRLKSARHKDWKSHLLTVVCRARSDEPAELPVAAAVPLSGVGNSACSPVMLPCAEQNLAVANCTCSCRRTPFSGGAQTVGFGLGRSEILYSSR